MASLRITPLGPEHASQAARLHIEGQPGTFLTALGPDVLTVVYRSLPQSPGGFGFAAERGAGVRAPRMVGYVSATTGVGGLFVEMAARRLPQLAAPLLRRYVQRPGLILRSVQTGLYPFFVHEDDNLPSAELLSIMVEPSARSQGVGGLLMAAFLQACRNRGIEAVTVTVDAVNDGAQRFYLRHDFAAWRSITLYGRAMLVLRRIV